MKRLFTILFLIALMITPSLIEADSDGPRNPAAATNDSTVGTIDWTSPGSVFASDNIYASALIGAGEVSKYLAATQFGFSIPANMRIDGITVEVERSTPNANTIADNSIKLIKGGSIVGNEKALTPDWPTTDTLQSYGGAADLWGTAWTPAEVNATDFGVAVSAKEGAAIGGGTARIDHIRITVTFTLQRRPRRPIVVGELDPTLTPQTQTHTARALYSQPSKGVNQ